MLDLKPTIADRKLFVAILVGLIAKIILPRIGVSEQETAELMTLVLGLVAAYLTPAEPPKQ